MASATRKVLIVDDDPWVGKLVEFVARDLDYEPVLARDGADALDRYAEELPDVVIADVVLPKVDGLEVCRRVKSTGPGAFTPVLVVSGIYRSEREALKRFRADGFYQKPLSPDVLQRRLAGLFPPTFTPPRDATLAPAGASEVGLDFEPLPRALARLYQQKKTGVLTLRVRGASAQFYLRDGRLTFARSEAWSESIGAILLRQQRLTPDQRAHLEKLVTQKGDPQSAGELAIREGFVTPEELLRLVTNQLVHRVLEAFRWREGFHSFEDGVQPQGAKNALDLDAPTLLHWGLRRGPARAEDLADFLPDRDLPLLRGDADVLRTLPMSRAEKWLLERADGSLTFDDLVAEVPSTDQPAIEAVRRAAMALCALGAITTAPRQSRGAADGALDEAPPEPAPPPAATRTLQGAASALLLEAWRRRATGTMVFDTASGPRTLCMRGGQLAAVRGGESERLEELLVRRGKIRPEVAAQVRMLVSPGRNVGDVLVELQAITAHQLQQFVRTELRAVLREIVRLRDLAISFTPGPLPEHELARHEWDAAQAVVDAVRSQDLPFVRTMLPSAGTLLARDPAADELAPVLPLLPNEKNLLNLLASPQPWERLAAVELVAAEDQQRACWVLCALGLVRPVTADEARQSAAAGPRAHARRDTDPLAGIDPAAVDGEEDVVVDVDGTPSAREEVLIEISSDDEPPFAVAPRPARAAPPRGEEEEPRPGIAPRRRGAAVVSAPATVAPLAPVPVARAATGDLVPRAAYDRLLAEKRELERRLFALLEKQSGSETVSRGIFDQIVAEKNELKAQVGSLLDELIRLKDATSFVAPATGPAPGAARRPVAPAAAVDPEEGGVITFRRTRS